MNKKLSDAGKNILKELLHQCTEPQQLLFKRMYSNDISLDINDVVDNIKDSNIDWAITQCERTVMKNRLNK